MTTLPWTDSFDSWASSPPYPGDNFTFGDPGERPLLWRQIDRYSNIPDVGRGLFHHAVTLKQKNALWHEFRGYARQAREYDSAAQHMTGTSGALLHYYCALNLAKAELLTLPANPITGQTVRHGLTFKPTVAQSVAGDRLIVSDGVFPLLYEKRTGAKLPLGTSLRVKRILQNIPEISRELRASGLGPPRSTRLLHTAVQKDSTGWSLLAFTNPHPKELGTAAYAVLTKSFKEIKPPSHVDWRMLFCVTKRFYSVTITAFYQSKKTVKVSPGIPQTSDVTTIANMTHSQLRPILDEPFDGSADATACGSLTDAKMLPMPSSLARYAAAFYLSSLVRYKPQAVDPRSNPTQAWLLAAFADQAVPHLLHSAVSSIEAKWHVYLSHQGLRQ